MFAHIWPWHCYISVWYWGIYVEIEMKVKIWFEGIELNYGGSLTCYDMNNKTIRACLTYCKRSKSLILSWPIINHNLPPFVISIRHAIFFLSVFNEIDYVNYRHADFAIDLERFSWYFLYHTVSFTQYGSKWISSK